MTPPFRRLPLNAAPGKAATILFGEEREAHVLARLPPLAARRLIQTTKAATPVECHHLDGLSWTRDAGPWRQSPSF